MGNWSRKGLQKILQGTTSVWHSIKWRISEGFSGRNHIPLSWSFSPSHSTMNLGDPCISLWLEEVQPTHSMFTLYRSWSLAPISEVGITVVTRMSGIMMSQFQKRHLGIFAVCQTLHTSCLAAGLWGCWWRLPCQRERWHENPFPAHLGFSIPSSAAHQGPPNNSTKAPKLTPLFGAEAWKMGSFPQTVISAWFPLFWNHLRLLKALQNLSDGLHYKLT